MNSKTQRNNVLVIADPEDLKYLDRSLKSDHWNLNWKIVNYTQLHLAINSLKESIHECNADFVLYTRNDQVSDKISIGQITRSLQIGYSSCSGIDEYERVTQMKQAYCDFVRCGNYLNADAGAITEESIDFGSQGTFSLIFDIEQVGGVRYGLPRLFQLLNRYRIPATFFVTNLISKVYRNVIFLMKQFGHEVGVHGLYHEYLSFLNPAQQVTQIREMIEDFDSNPVGANFMYRMNEDSLLAFITNNIRYFVYPLINRYHLISYPKLITRPTLLNLPSGSIWGLPISVETYGSPWFSIKNMIDSSLRMSKKNAFKHVSILGHAFRDANSSHIQSTENLIRYLLNSGLKAITLSSMVKELDVVDNSSFMSSSAERILSQKTRELSCPSCLYDIMGFFPENTASLIRRLRRRRNLSSF